MTVKVTIEFPNVDAAIVALGKLTKAADTVLVDGKPRKGRNDKGKPRGPHKDAPAPIHEAAAPSTAGTAVAGAASHKGATSTANETTDPSKAEGVAASTSTTSDPTEVAASSGETVAVAAESDAQKALEKLFALPPEKGGGIDGARDAMARFGVKRLRELPADQRAAFIAHVESVIAGGKP